jgi:putative ABC transport system permease protein
MEELSKKQQILQYQAQGIDIPKTINITVPQIEVTYHNFTVVGIAEGSWLSAASVSGIQLAKACYISYNTLNDIYPKYADDATLFFAETRSIQDVETAKQEIERQYGAKHDFEIITRNEIVSDLRKDIDQIFVSLYVPVLFAALNAVIGVLSIMIINVNSRTREIGILRSQGMSRAQIITCTVGEVLVLGSIGFITAIALGLIFQSIIVQFMNISGFIMPQIISINSIEIAIIEAIAISTISAAYPAYRASKLDIVNSLRAT